MGYRSDVSLTMFREDYKRMLARAKGLENKNPLNLLRMAEIYANNDESIVTLYWSSVKWYSSYDDVSFIESFIHEKNESDDEIPYKFIRIGEECNDIEIEYSNNGDGFECPDLDYMTYTVSEIVIDGRNIPKEELE